MACRVRASPPCAAEISGCAIGRSQVPGRRRPARPAHIEDVAAGGEMVVFHQDTGGHQRGDSMAAYGQLSMATVTASASRSSRRPPSRGRVRCDLGAVEGPSRNADREPEEARWGICLIWSW
jgi:hypothetical protein